MDKIGDMSGPEIFKVRELLCSNHSGKGTGLTCSECNDGWEKEIRTEAAKAAREHFKRQCISAACEYHADGAQAVVDAIRGLEDDGA